MFKCKICGEEFENKYKDRDYDDICKYCVEFEVHNESLKKGSVDNNDKIYL